jgi:hypothetical protein
VQRSALVDACETRFGDTSNDVIAAAVWQDYLTEGERRVHAASSMWPWLEAEATNLSVTAGSNEANLPADVWRVLTVFNATDEIAMHELTGRRSGIDNWPTRGDYTGTPEFYRLRAGKLQVFPWAAADTTIYIEYPVAPAVMSQEPVFPEQYHDCLVHFALARAYEDDENYAAAERHDAQFERILHDMKADLLSVRGDSYPQIAETWWD